MSAWTGAGQAVLNRVIKHIPVNVIIFYHSILGMTVVGIIILLEAAITGDGFRFLQYTGRQFGYLTASCVCDSIALFAFTMAFLKDKSGFIGLLSYIRLILLKIFY